MTDMRGQVVIITGGETGIGRATVMQLAKAGARVVIGGILEDHGAATVKAVSEVGGKVEFQRTDVRSSEQVNQLVDGTVARYGGLDGLINNAAIFDGFVNCIDTSDALWDQIIDVNLRGTFYGCRAALRHMVAAGRG